MTTDDVTPPLAKFREQYEKDDNVWWTIGCGHHMNLFDAACEEIDRLMDRLAECAGQCHPSRLVGK